MMKTIWLVRHGESNAQTGNEGWADPSLSNRGRCQAKRLIPILENVGFSHAFISPLQRARHTYELAQGKATYECFDSRIVECSYGRTYDEILPYLTPNYAQADQQNAWNNPIAVKVKSFAEGLRKCTGKKILLVGHWAVFSLLLQHLLGHEDLNDPYPNLTTQSLILENAAIGKIVLGHPRFGNALIQWNSCAHIEDIISPTIAES